MTDVIILVTVAVIAGLAGLYVYNAKKRGRKCIGCPHSGNCSSCNNN